jgi:hypothetical protein
MIKKQAAAAIPAAAYGEISSFIFIENFIAFSSLYNRRIL